MKPPGGSASRYFAAALLGAMSVAFTYQGISKRFPESLVGAAILLVGVWLAMRKPKRKPDA
jgi:hypothetical protein